MVMSPALRKLVLGVHIAVSVGWIGALAAYLVFDLTVVASDDVTTLRASYVAMALVTTKIIIPLALLALLTGLILSLATKWGLFRHYWTVISLILTLFALVVLLIETQTVLYFSSIAADPATTDAALRSLGSTLLHSIGGTVVLLVVMWLNILKPRGLTAYGWRKQQAELAPSIP
jgi:hypothetical protein